MAIPGLTWVAGLVVLLESAHFALSPAAAHEVAQMGFPRWLPTALGGSEALAALLFLVPTTRLAAGYALLFLFAIAVAIHFAAGQYNVGALLVYAMAVLVGMTRQSLTS
jgi:hypothetical protein